MKIYGKSEKGIPGTDGQRSDQLWKEDGTDASDLGTMVPGTGIQYRGSGLGQVRRREADHHGVYRYGRAEEG